jgi:superoxide dismutase, Fe-Mn family
VATLSLARHTPKKWDLSGLHGISDKTLETHFGLYEGYVKNTNLLNEEIAELTTAGRAVGSEPRFAELRRRLGFEESGMRLHEYYFGNLAKGGGGQPPRELSAAVGGAFGDFETWKKDFVATGGMRGVGWAIAYQDPSTGNMSNHWITLHEDGGPAGLRPILVMDVWEHAFMLDYKPADRGAYIEAFFANVDWSAVAARLRPSAGQ